MKRFVSALTATLMLVSICNIGAFASEEPALHSWYVAKELLEAAKNAAGDANAVNFGAISYDCRYGYDTGIGEVSYSETDNSYFVADGAGEPYYTQAVIPDNQGVGEGKNTQGVILYFANETPRQKLVFTAPVSGIYSLVPEQIGGSDSIEDSLKVSYNASANISVNVNGEQQIMPESNSTELLLERSTTYGDSGNLPTLSEIELKKGETIEIIIKPSSNGWTGAYYALVNFRIDLTDELPVVAVNKSEAETYSLTEELQLTDTDAATIPSSGLITAGYYGDSFKGTKITPENRKGVFVEKTDTVPAHTWYYGYGNDGNGNYGMTASSETDTLSIFGVSKIFTQGIIITAEKSGTYTVSADSIKKGGDGRIYFRIENADGIIYSTSNDDTNGFSVSAELEAGEKLYVYGTSGDVSGNSYKVDVTGLELKIEETEFITDYNYVYQYTENLAFSLYAEAEYALSDKTISVTFPKAPDDNTLSYNWAVWVEQDGRWVKMTTEDGLYFSLSDVTSADGVYRIYVLCTDTSGNTLLEDYSNYVDEVTAESVGNAVISAVYVNGKLVNGDVYVDINSPVSLRVEGSNIKSLSYIFGSKTGSFTDCTASIELDKVGKYMLVINAESSEGKESDSFKTVINGYSSEDTTDHSTVENVTTNVADESVSVEVESYNADSFDYHIKPNDFGTGISKTNSKNNKEKFNLSGMYGYYHASIHAKDADGNVGDVFIKHFYLSRPGGKWKLDSKLNGKNSKKYNAKIGETLNFTSSASFPELSDVEYLIFKKDANGTSVIKDWDKNGNASFTPTYAGHYEITIAARGKGAGSYEVFDTYYIEVGGNRAKGRVDVRCDGNKNKSPITFTASAPEANEELLYRFTLTTNGNTKIIQTYSPSNACTWVPDKPGNYKIKVEVMGAESFGMYDIRDNIEFTVQ